jgi:phosphate transport system substrate-binding protein
VNRTSIRRVVAPSTVVLALGFAVTACGAANEDSPRSGGDAGIAGSGSASGSSISGTLNGAGSSAQQAAQAAWAADFQGRNPDVTVNYDPSGSGAGVEQFLAGGVQFAGTDKYLDDGQMTSSKKACEGSAAIEVPSYISPIALVYNLSGVDKLQLSPSTAAKVFSGRITKWDDPAIATDNPGAKLPSETITPVHRSDDSGTTNNFTDWLHQTAAADWADEAGETWPMKSGEGAEGTSGVIDAVSKGRGTIGYADASQAGDLGVASIKVGATFVPPTADAAAKAADVSKTVSGRPGTDLALTVNRTTKAAGAYPLVLVSYLVACPSYQDAEAADLVKSYLTYVVSAEGQASAAKAAGSAPLPSTLVTKATSALSGISGSS